MRIEELALPFGDCSFEWASLGRAGELAPEVWVLESWWADQLKYLSGPYLGLRTGPPQHLSH